MKEQLLWQTVWEIPIIGDGLPIAAGWLKLNAWKSSIILMAGKFARYAMLLAGLHIWT